MKFDNPPHVKRAKWQTESLIVVGFPSARFAHLLASIGQQFVFELQHYLEVMIGFKSAAQRPSKSAGMANTLPV